MSLSKTDNTVGKQDLKSEGRGCVCVSLSPLDTVGVQLVSVVVLMDRWLKTFLHC